MCSRSGLDSMDHANGTSGNQEGKVRGRPSVPPDRTSYDLGCGFVEVGTLLSNGCARLRFLRKKYWPQFFGQGGHQRRLSSCPPTKNDRARNRCRIQNIYTEPLDGGWYGRVRVKRVCVLEARPAGNPRLIIHRRRRPPRRKGRSLINAESRSIKCRKRRNSCSGG